MGRVRVGRVRVGRMRVGRVRVGRVRVGETIPDHIFNLRSGRHSSRYVYIALILVSEYREHLEVVVARGGHLEEIARDRDHLARRGAVPRRRRPLDANLLAILPELAVLLDAELEELAVGAVGGAVRVGWHWVRLVVLVLSQQLLGASLLELGVVGARLLREEHELLGRLQRAHVVATDLRHHLASLVLELTKVLQRALRHLSYGYRGSAFFKGRNADADPLTR